jgi:S-adenosylmethionine/arginine decarboxylase-like enzyme
MKAQIYNYAVWVNETNPKALKKKYNKLLSQSGFNVLDVAEKHFEPFGYTALFLLSESHFAIHTFPEHNETYIELSSCVKQPFNLFVQNHE